MFKFFYVICNFYACVWYRIRRTYSSSLSDSSPLLDVSELCAPFFLRVPCSSFFVLFLVSLRAISILLEVAEISCSALFMLAMSSAKQHSFGEPGLKRSKISAESLGPYTKIDRLAGKQVEEHLETSL